MLDASLRSFKNEDSEEKSGPIAVSWKKSMIIINIISRSFRDISYFYYNFSGAIRHHLRQIYTLIPMLTAAIIKQIPKTTTRPNSKVSSSPSGKGQS